MLESVSKIYMVVGTSRPNWRKKEIYLPLPVFETEIGLGLTAFGVFFSFLGIVFLFDKGLLAMGNILFISGVTLTIGLKSTVQFFMKRQNYKGTISFGVGFFFVIIGWPILGMMLEAYGFIVLFSGFWPTLAVFLQKIPFLGWVFQQPFVRSEAMDFFSAKLHPSGEVVVL
ncbi:Vesicle transport protein GOT1 [Vitis vinifera]|uniref:Vesicle transport protein GOT1 n=1 Tax=Vitis vinifera TaxID=29760 RepID=A0A438JZM3_VITVI|nr:Vesicle transport protein GOT1 [Vitis vinifera]